MLSEHRKLSVHQMHSVTVQFYNLEISQFNVHIMSNLNIPGMFRPEGCRNANYWCMTF